VDPQVDAEKASKDDDRESEQSAGEPTRTRPSSASAMLAGASAPAGTSTPE